MGRRGRKSEAISLLTMCGYAQERLPTITAPKDKGRDDHVPRAEGLTAHFSRVGAGRGPSSGSSTLDLICNVATAPEAFAVAPRETVSSYRTILCRLLYLRSKHSDRDCFFLAGWLQAGWANETAGPSCLEPVAGQF